MTSSVKRVVRLARATAARATRRERAHLARVGRALRSAGPGRVPGEVLDASIDGQAIVVRGWAALPRTRILAVLLTVDGTPVSAAELGLGTPRRADDTPVTTRTPSAGWRAHLSTFGLAPGSHALGAVVVLASGLTEELRGSTVEVPTHELAPGWIDAPSDGCSIEAPMLWVDGWARTDIGVSRVEIRLGDGRTVRARRSARPEIAARSDHPGAPLAGWHALVEVPPLDAPAELVLTVEAVRAEGIVELGRRTIRVAPRAARPADDSGRAAAIAARTSMAIRRHRAPAGQPMHLLVATHHLGLGGGQLYLQQLLGHLLEAEDIRCTTLSSVDGPLRDQLEAAGATVHIVGSAPTTAVPFEQWLHLVAAAALDGGCPSAVLANTAGSFWAVDLADRLGRPSVWAIHESLTPEQFLVLGLAQPVDDHVAGRFRSSFARAGAVVFEADATADLYRDHIGDQRRIRLDYGIDLDRIAAYRDAEDRSAIRRTYGFGPDDVVLLSMGTFETRKAQGTMALAFAAIADEHPEASLVMVGDGGGDYADALRGVVDRLDLGDRVRLLPVTPEIDPWYHAADALVIGSDIESLPMSMLEAMAFGRPIIATAAFGIPEVIHDGVEGLLFEPLDLDAMTVALRRFLTSPLEERAAMGTKARAVAEARPPRAYADAYRAMLDGLVADPTGTPREILGW